MHLNTPNLPNIMLSLAYLKCAPNTYIAYSSEIILNFISRVTAFFFFSPEAGDTQIDAL